MLFSGRICEFIGNYSGQPLRVSAGAPVIAAGAMLFRLFHSAVAAQALFGALS